MADLFITGFSSRCGGCQRGAAPEETHHTTRLDYGDHDGKGCGVEFTSVSTDLFDPEPVRKMRPDLPLVGRS